MKSKKLLSAIILTNLSLLTATVYAVCANTSVADCPKECFAAPEVCPAKCPETKWPSYPHCSRYAMLPGFYVGAQIGYSELYYTEQDLNASSNATNINNTGTGGRIYGGYQFNQYWAAEVGYERFAKASVHNLTNGSYKNVSGDIQHTAYDAVGKFTFPLVDSGFNVYAKAGGAYLQRQVSSDICNAGSVCSEWNLLFTYGLGATYNLTRHIPLEFAWTRIQHNDTITNSDLFTVGLGYYFG